MGERRAMLNSSFHTNTRSRTTRTEGRGSERGGKEGRVDEGRGEEEETGGEGEERGGEENYLPRRSVSPLPTSELDQSAPPSL